MKTQSRVSAILAAGIASAQDVSTAATTVLDIDFNTSGAPIMEQFMPVKLALHQEMEAAGMTPLRTAASLGATRCVDGFADIFPCKDIDLASFTTHFDLGSDDGQGNDIWGWVDPETGDEIAIVGQFDGTAFVRVNRDGSIVYLGRLPTNSSVTVWRDIKTYQSYAIIGSEAPGHFVQFFNLERLRDVDPANPPVFDADSIYTWDGVGNSHNVVVNEDSGFLYIVGSRDAFDGGLHFVDVRDPANPTFAGGFGDDGYVHDAQCVNYNGPDRRYRGREICACYNEDTLTFVDVTEKDAPVQVSRTGYERAFYTHQGWWTSDFRTILLDDELDEFFEQRQGVNDGKTRTLFWDVRDLEQPRYLGDFLSTESSIDHNQYTRGRYSYQSNYTAGLRILDVRRAAQARAREVAYFDAHPEPLVDGLVVFMGTWSVYPYFKSGNVVLNSTERGLFVVKPYILMDSDSDSDSDTDDTDSDSDDD